MSVQPGVDQGAREDFDRSRAPDIGEPPSVVLPEVQDYTLTNGMRVVLVERGALPLVNVELQLRGGAAYHATEDAGLAALTADMLDEGTESRSALEIAGAMDLLGASFSSLAGYDASHLTLSVLRTRFPQALDILADVVMRPSFLESELDRVRRERIARVLQRSDDPGALADDAFVRVLFGPEHPYGVTVLGTTGSLESLTRDDAVAYHRARYAPAQATLLVVGDVSRTDLDSLVARAFAGWTGHGLDAPAPPTAPDPSELRIYIVDKPGAPQSEIRVGSVGLDRRTESYFPVAVMNTVLGGSFTSRLNMKLREERGFTYGAGSWFDMRRAPGPFEVSTAVATAVTDGAVADIVAEMDRLRTAPVSADELTRARNYLALRLPQRFEAADDVVRRLSELVVHDVPLHFYEGYVDSVLAVDEAAVAKAAATHLLTHRMVVVIAGDRSVIEGPLAALGLGPVVVLPGPRVPQG